jgi:predicted GNAT family N-acyltransferase
MKTYSQFIKEGKSPKQDAHITIGRNYERKYPGMKAHVVNSHQGDVKLHSLEVPKELRGKGIGSKFMKGLTKSADKQKQRITLSQQSEPRYKKKLDTFYKRFGFVSNKGRNKDFSVSDTMIRKPNS